MPNRLPTPRSYVTPRISEHKQLLLLSSISICFWRLSKYSFAVVEQLTPTYMFSPHLPEFDDDDGDVAGSIYSSPHAQLIHYRHSRHLTMLRTANLPEIGFYDILGAPCSMMINDCQPNHHPIMNTTPTFPTISHNVQTSSLCPHRVIARVRPLPGAGLCGLQGLLPAWVRAWRWFLFHITFSFFRIIAPSFFNLWLQCILRVCWDQSTIRMRHQRAIFWLPVSYFRRIDIRFWLVQNLKLEAGAASRPVRPMDGVALSVFLNGVLFAS